MFKLPLIENKNNLQMLEFPCLKLQNFHDIYIYIYIGSIFQILKKLLDRSAGLSAPIFSKVFKVLDARHRDIYENIMFEDDLSCFLELFEVS